MKRKYKHFLFTLTSSILLSTVPYCTTSAWIEGKFGEVTTTINGQHYKNSTDVSSSYLAINGNEYLRVAAYSTSRDKDSWSFGSSRVNPVDKIVIEHYNANFEIQHMQYLIPELPLFGGFYSNDSNYYLVFGQENKSENDSVEVVRIVKYDKNWNRIAAASVYGSNTSIPFDAGNLRFAEYGGYLYIRTAHEMYKSEDGRNHQSNMTIEIRESDMKVVDSFYDVFNSSVGYVSHSFNQFIIVDDNANLVALDHGDAHPRSAFLGKYDTKAGNETFCSGYNCYNGISVLEYQGEAGNNYTGATVGGLEYSDSCYLTVGSSVVQDENYRSRKTQNVYVTATKKDSFSSANTTFSWITNLEEGSTVSVSSPLLVKRSNNSFVVLWSQIGEDYKENATGGTANGKFSYVFLDSEGKTVSPIYTENGYTSDCQPVVSNDGSVVWYALKDGILSFYQIKKDGSLSVKPITPTLTSAKSITNGIEIAWESVPNAAKYRLYRKDANSNDRLSPLVDTADASTSFVDSTALIGRTYTYSIKSLDSNDNEMHGSFDWEGKTVKREEPENTSSIGDSNSPIPPSDNNSSSSSSNNSTSNSSSSDSPFTPPIGNSDSSVPPSSDNSSGNSSSDFPYLPPANNNSNFSDSASDSLNSNSSVSVPSTSEPSAPDNILDSDSSNYTDEPLDVKVEIEKKTMKLSSVKVKVKNKKLKKITGKISTKNATVKIKVGNKKYKKAHVAGNKFTLNLSLKIKNSIQLTIKATKVGYKKVIKTTTVIIS